MSIFCYFLNRLAHFQNVYFISDFFTQLRAMKHVRTFLFLAYCYFIFKWTGYMWKLCSFKSLSSSSLYLIYFFLIFILKSNFLALASVAHWNVNLRTRVSGSIPGLGQVPGFQVPSLHPPIWAQAGGNQLMCLFHIVISLSYSLSSLPSLIYYLWKAVGGGNRNILKWGLFIYLFI